jgi:hypothetical protein
VRPTRSAGVPDPPSGQPATYCSCPSNGIAQLPSTVTHASAQSTGTRWPGVEYSGHCCVVPSLVRGASLRCFAGSDGEDEVIEGGAEPVGAAGVLSAARGPPRPGCSRAARQQDIDDLAMLTGRPGRGTYRRYYRTASEITSGGNLRERGEGGRVPARPAVPRRHTLCGAGARKGLAPGDGHAAGRGEPGDETGDGVGGGADH